MAQHRRFASRHRDRERLPIGGAEFHQIGAVIFRAVDGDFVPLLGHAYIAARSSLPSLNRGEMELPAEFADVGLLKHQLTGALPVRAEFPLLRQADHVGPGVRGDQSVNSRNTSSRPDLGQVHFASRPALSIEVPERVLFGLKCSLSSKMFPFGYFS